MLKPSMEFCNIQDKGVGKHYLLVPEVMCCKNCTLVWPHDHKDQNRTCNENSHEKLIWMFAFINIILIPSDSTSKHIFNVGGILLVMMWCR